MRVSLDQFVLYSTRAHGWFTVGSTYSSDYKQAKTFNITAAIEFCKKHKTDSGYGMFPVSLEDLKSI